MAPLHKLGRIPTPPHLRARVPRLARLPYRLPAGPSAMDLGINIDNWPMYGNDRIGDCTVAAAAHQLEVWTEEVDGKPRLLTDQDVIALYETQGYNPNDPSTDQGAVMVNVLDAWRKIGLAGDPIRAYAAVNVADHAEVQSAAWLFSGVYIGINLPISAQTQAVWDLPPGGTTGAGAPGSWGGHCVNVVGYDAAGLTVVTWGALKRMTWAFWGAYVDEAYVAFPTDYDRLGSRLLPNGMTEDQLLVDLAALHPTPPPPPPPPPAPAPAPDPGPVARLIWAVGDFVTGVWGWLRDL